MSGNTEQCVLGLMLIHLTSVGGAGRVGLSWMESQSRATSYDSAEWGTGIPQNWESVQARDYGLKVFRSSLQISFIFF